MRISAVVTRLRTRAALRTPPSCPAGWTVAPPDFVGLGAQLVDITNDVFASQMKAEVEKAARLAKELGIRND